MSARRIQILSSQHLCRNPRVVKEATTLGAAGYDVTVVTLSTTDRFEETDRQLIASLPFRRVTVDCRRSTAPWHSLRMRATTWFARKALSLTGIESAASLGAAGPLLRQSRAVPADLTIAHTEIPIWAARPLISSGRHVGVDFEDWHSEDLLEGDRRTRPLRLLRKAEAYALQRARFAFTTSQAMADALGVAYGIPAPTVIRNVFPLQKDPRTARADGSAEPGFIWFSQTVGPGRGLEYFIAAWNRITTPSRLTLLGEITAEYRAKLIALVRPEQRDRLMFRPLVPPGELAATLAEFDVGLALEARHPRNKDLTISNKIFQYLNAGLAVIATDTTGQREVMARAGRCGLLVTEGDPAQLALQLDEVLRDRAQLRACQVIARRAAELEFCWEKEAPRLLNVVDQSLGE